MGDVKWTIVFRQRTNQVLNLVHACKQINIEIDKLTRSVQNAVSGDSFKTEVLPLSQKDIQAFKKTDWLFDWKSEAKTKDKTVYKLVIVNNPDIIQGLISLQDRVDLIFMHLIESIRFNRGARKIYLGVPGNFVASVSYHSTKAMKDMYLLKARQNLLAIIGKP